MSQSQHGMIDNIIAGSGGSVAISITRLDPRVGQFDAYHAAHNVQSKVPHGSPDHTQVTSAHEAF